MSKLHTDISNLKGLGEKSIKHFERLGIKTLGDLLFYLPSGYVERHFLTSPTSDYLNKNVTLPITIRGIEGGGRHNRYGSKRVQCRIWCYVGKIPIDIVYFNYVPHYLLDKLVPDSKWLVSGVLAKYQNIWQITHPDLLIPYNEKFAVSKLLPTYPLTYGLTQNMLSKYIEIALSHIPILPEWLDEDIKKNFNWPGFAEAVKACHDPKNFNEVLEGKHKAFERLAYEEILAQQIALKIMRNNTQVMGKSYKGSKILIDKLIEQLKFELTDSQLRAIDEILSDQYSDKRMMRLLQGDVGSGKTLVAIYAMLNTIEAGGQVAFMVPTNILAQQHYNYISALTKDCDLKIALLTSNIKRKDQDRILSELESGVINVVIGTHSLFQEQVKFSNLSFIIVDEQHRFGVEQRLALSYKANHSVDTLLMSATPIPRSLALTIYGDMDISCMYDKPKSRLPIKTSVISHKNTENVIDSLERILQENGKIYWICPAIEELVDNEISIGSMMTVTERAEILSAKLNREIGIVHGKQTMEERDKTMQAFVGGDINLLVATTVIEVGIDVPDATVIVIEHAERFGMSQLHQLRGRVGRGAQQSYCILLYYHPISTVAKERLEVLRTSNDGFYIAEQDLKLRGGGEILGTKQSGWPDFKFFMPLRHYHLLEEASKEADKLLSSDPMLTSPRGKNLRILLSIFKYDHYMKYLEAG